MPLNIARPQVPSAPNFLSTLRGNQNPQGDALANQLARKRMGRLDMQNALDVRGEQRAVAGEQRAGETHEMDMRQKSFVLQHKVMAAMISDPNMEAEFGPEYKEKYGDFEIERDGDDVKFTDNNGNISEGPSKAVVKHKMALANLQAEPGSADEKRDKFDAIYNAALMENVNITMAAEEEGDGQPVFKQKIEAILKAIPGVSRGQATKIVTGGIKVQQDPVTQEISLVDLTDNTVSRLSVADQAAPAEAKDNGEPRRTIWDMTALGTGPLSALKSGASAVSGMVGGPIAEKTVEARQYIKSAQNDLIRALSINPRFPVGEINRIREEINISPTIFDNPKQMQHRAVAIDEYLKGRIEKELKTAQNRMIPSKQRQAAIQSANDIEHFLGLLGVPTRIKNDEDFDGLKSGQQFIDPKGTLRTKK